MVTPGLRAHVWVIGLVAAAKAVEMVEDLCYGVFQRHRRMNEFGKSLVLRGTIGLGVVVVLLALSSSIEICIAAMLGVWSAVLLAFDIPKARGFRARFPDPAKLGRTRRLLWLATPMGTVRLLSSLTQNIPSYFLELMAGTAKVGIYVAMAYIVRLGSMVVFALGAPLATAMAQDFADGRRADFVRRSGKLLGITLTMGIAGLAVAAVAGEFLLRLVYSPEFAANADVFVWVMMGAAMYYVVVMFNDILTTARALWVQSLVWGAAAGATALGAWLWVPERGVLGAAHAFVLGVAVALVLALASFFWVIRRMPSPAATGLRRD
jgi:O-antigen/teichoic acid export membrane protein